MSAGIIRRALQRGLAKLGGASSLRGAPCGNVHIARDVEVFASIMDQANDNHVVKAVVATIDSQYLPRVDDVLVHPEEGTFRLMRLLSDNGFTRRYIVVQTA